MENRVKSQATGLRDCAPMPLDVVTARTTDRAIFSCRPIAGDDARTSAQELVDVGSLCKDGEG